MECLRKFKWVKLPRKETPELKGWLGYWLKLAESAAFRKGIGTCLGWNLKRKRWMGLYFFVFGR